MKDLGEIHWLLNLKIERDFSDKTISISQETYIDKIIKKINLQDAKDCSTPLDLNIKLSKDQFPNSDEEKKTMAKVPYRQTIGSLMWATVATRPDIAFAVSVPSQFLENPGRVHWEAVKRVMRYLESTKIKKLILGKRHEGLIGHADMDWASQDHRHSISVYIFQIDGGPISWSCKKQTIVALSSTEAELIALTHATKEAMWMKNFITEAFQPLKFPIKIYSDNQSAITISYGNQQHAITKHFNIGLYFIHDNIQDKMLADLLTKGLPSPRVNKLLQKIGIY